MNKMIEPSSDEVKVWEWLCKTGKAEEMQDGDLSKKVDKYRVVKFSPHHAGRLTPFRSVKPEDFMDMPKENWIIFMVKAMDMK